MSRSMSKQKSPILDVHWSETRRERDAYVTRVRARVHAVRIRVSHHHWVPNWVYPVFICFCPKHVC